MRLHIHNAHTWPIVISCSDVWHVVAGGTLHRIPGSKESWPAAEDSEENGQECVYEYVTRYFLWVCDVLPPADFWHRRIHAELFMSFICLFRSSPPFYIYSSWEIRERGSRTIFSFRTTARLLFTVASDQQRNSSDRRCLKNTADKTLSQCQPPGVVLSQSSPHITHNATKERRLVLHWCCHFWDMKLFRLSQLKCTELRKNTSLCYTVISFHPLITPHSWSELKTKGVGGRQERDLSPSVVFQQRRVRIYRSLSCLC